MNLAVLRQKLATLATHPDLDAGALRKLGEVLPGLGDWDLLRINPLRFAEQYGIASGPAIDLFVHAARVGIFDLSWNLVCPTCGILIDSHASVNGLQGEVFHCTLCNVDVPSHLDDQVEVTFAINPALRQIDIEPFRDFSNYWRFVMSENFRRSRALSEYVNETRRGEALIDPDQSWQIAFDAEPLTLYRLMSPENHTACFIRTNDQRASNLQSPIVDLLESGFTPDDISVSPGRVSLSVQNSLARNVGVVLVLTDFERLERILRDSPSRILPFFTGKMLLNNQTFRNLFRVQDLLPDLKLKLRSLTILFTDLKGSTDLYARSGDAFAYSLVQEHYRLLSEAVRAHSGAVIKTMGDAIMASFSEPDSAARAAILMMSSIDSLNQELQARGNSLGLKIGMHEGSALVVNADERLDYFGQTVNIAARVQALADEGEIWLTEPVFKASGVRESLGSASYQNEKHLVSLKGVGEATTVYRFRRTDYQAAH